LNARLHADRGALAVKLAALTPRPEHRPNWSHIWPCSTCGVKGGEACLPVAADKGGGDPKGIAQPASGSGEPTPSSSASSGASTNGTPAKGVPVPDVGPFYQAAYIPEPECRDCNGGCNGWHDYLRTFAEATATDTLVTPEPDETRQPWQTCTLPGPDPLPNWGVGPYRPLSPHFRPTGSDEVPAYCQDPTCYCALT
jgi:hypothetical protein